MLRFIDSAVGVAKESAKTFTRESFNNGVNAVNGLSDMLLRVIPVRLTTGWESRPALRAPRLPGWMDDNYSSFNRFIYDSYTELESEFNPESEGEEDGDHADLSEPESPSVSSSSSYHSTHSTELQQLPDSSPRLHYRRSLSRQPWLLRTLLIMMFWPYLLFKKYRRKLRAANRARASGEEALSRVHSSSSISRQFSMAGNNLSRRLNEVMDYVSHLNDNQRRGIIEDMHVWLELGIERVFEAVRAVIHSVLSPWMWVRTMTLSLSGRGHGSISAGVGPSAPAPVPAPRGRAAGRRFALNSDARTCEDVISSAGYPFEEVKVTTVDGYVLTLQRIPRRNSRKVVLLQHGILDTSLGWVSNGPVGSQAFAAYDQGYDVWLGNMRGYANREHVNPTISATEYWNYSLNEHGMCDIPAMVDRIHGCKMSELQPLPAGSSAQVPYVLCGVGHSLGGAAMMIHVVTKRLQGEPHRFHRLILLSPAGFHEQCPLLFTVLGRLIPLLEPLMRRFMPGLFIPTSMLRLLFNKLTQDFQNIPALRALLQVIISTLLVGGDGSDWVGALRQPHYNVNDMPGLSFYVMKHMAQMKWSKRFLLFDYGSVAANRRRYGHSHPLDVASQYGLVDIPVDVVMGRKDFIVPAAMVARHYQHLKAAGRRCSLKEFEFAHLDFTFAQHQELLAYVMSRLRLAVQESGVEGTCSSARKKVE